MWSQIIRHSVSDDVVDVIHLDWVELLLILVHRILVGVVTVVALGRFVSVYVVIIWHVVIHGRVLVRSRSGDITNWI